MVVMIMVAITTAVATVILVMAGLLAPIVAAGLSPARAIKSGRSVRN